MPGLVAHAIQCCIRDIHCLETRGDGAHPPEQRASRPETISGRSAPVSYTDFGPRKCGGGTFVTFRRRLDDLHDRACRS